jgi:hypothetical protein
MKPLTVALCLLCGCAVEPSGQYDQSVPSDLGPVPPPPTLGTQIDRIGRPAINTLVTDPFYLGDSVTGMNAVTPLADAHKDLYNSDGQVASWPRNWASVFVPNLAIFDALDGVCGNQWLASTQSDGGGRYTQLAALFADDQLYLDTTRAGCSASYLGVEGRALGLPVSGCGGRTPLDDVVDVTYSLLGEGADYYKGARPIGDGVAADEDALADGGQNVSLDVFPFLGPPGL